MTDREYDALVAELGDLEKKTGIRFSDSPTERVSGNVKKELPKVQHSKPMLSVKKTKSTELQKEHNKQIEELKHRIDELDEIVNDNEECIDDLYGQIDGLKDKQRKTPRKHSIFKGFWSE